MESDNKIYDECNMCDNSNIESIDICDKCELKYCEECIDECYNCKKILCHECLVQCLITYKDENNINHSHLLDIEDSNRKLNGHHVCQDCFKKTKEIQKICIDCFYRITNKVLPIRLQKKSYTIEEILRIHKFYKKNE